MYAGIGAYCRTSILRFVILTKKYNPLLRSTLSQSLVSLRLSVDMMDSL